MKLLRNFSLMLSITLSTATWAGPSVGGGGDVIVLPDDSVVLADPWIDSGVPQPNNMPPLRALNPRIIQAIALYSKASSNLVNQLSSGKKQSDIALLLSVLATRKNDLRFYGVRDAEELNNFCAPGGRKIYQLPNGAKVQQVACTAGEETFIVEPLFVRLSLRDQALLLIHERLTTLRDQFGGKNYSAVARFTTGLDVFLNIYSEQAKRKIRTLTILEQKILTDFYIAIEEIERRNDEVTINSFQWIAHINGGGRIHASANVDQNSIITLDAVISAGSEVAEGARVQNLDNPNFIPLFLAKNAVLENASLSFKGNNKPSGKSAITLASGAVVSNASLINVINNFSFGEGASVKNTIIDSAQFIVGDRSVIVDSKFDTDSFVIGSDAEFRSASVLHGELKASVANGEKLINKSILLSTYQNYFPKGIQLKPIDMVLTVSEFQVTESTKLAKDQFKIDYKVFNDKGDGVALSGQMSFLSREGTIFHPIYRYSYGNMQIHLVYKNFKMSTDTDLLMISPEGHFVNAGYERASLKVSISAIPSQLMSYTFTNIGSDKGIRYLNGFLEIDPKIQ
ncbi:MAG: hypothetical protein Q7U04_01035 [Bacteriovorax sp.]|nr:hypothetical protein [Bacteriovorax sp.]